MKKTVGARVRARRLKLGITQGELAEAADIRPNTVYRIESNRIVEPSGETLGRLATALASTVDELLGRRKSKS